MNWPKIPYVQYPLGGGVRPVSGPGTSGGAGTFFPAGGPLQFSGFTTPSTIANTAAETLFTQWTMPANAVSVVGSLVRIRAGFIYSTTGTPALSIRCYLGGLLGLKIMDRGLAATENNCANVAAVYDVEFAWDSAAATAAVLRFPGSVAVYGAKSAVSTTAVAVLPQVTGAFGTVDFSAPLDVGFSGQWDAADPANTMTLEAMTVEVLYPASVA